jgi:tRNA A-37 threonylcarbamoyl transferase component Bud32
MQLQRGFGRYSVVRRLAIGGTSEIYLAEFVGDGGFKKRVAIKALLSSWYSNDDVRRLMEDEARLLQSLNHQSIVQMIDYGIDDGIPFIVMEYVNGVDCLTLLTKLIRESKRLPPEYVLYISSQILIALDYAHGREMDCGVAYSLIHRDISPANILFSWHGEVKLADFGIAKGLHRTASTRAGLIRGKYSYMSPEQARGEKIDARSDLFSLAIVMMELLVGGRVFDAPTDAEVLECVREVAIPDLKFDLMPQGLRSIITPALSRNIGTRYQSASEMLKDVAMMAKDYPTVTSIEFGEYLKEMFGRVQRDRRLPLDVVDEVRQTRVIAGEGRRRGRMLNFVKGLAATLCLLLSLSISPAGNMSKAVRKEAAGTVGVEKIAVMPSPPAKGFLIAIDSEPADAEVELDVGDERRVGTTPFVLNGFGSGDAVDGLVRLRHEGYEEDVERFRLTSAAPEFVKKYAMRKEEYGSIVIQARPWGIVEIDGGSKGETPAGARKIKAGRHVVSVKFPPAGKRIQREIEVGREAALRCLASFEGQPTLKCR